MARSPSSQMSVGAALLLGVAALFAPHAPVAPAGAAGTARVVAWNNLGMHCMDSDYSVFSILPPYNTVHAQLVLDGALARSASGLTVTYEAVADPSGSITTSSVGRTNFWEYVLPLYGADVAPDHGLAGNSMPGIANVPQPMAFDPAMNWFIAEGIPITPRDDTAAGNTYPMMRIVARAASGVLAETVVVLPVSDEMDCRACHASGSGPAARPAAGWVNAVDPEKDYRLNILRRHDDLNMARPSYAAALATLGLDPAGLYVTATKTGGRPVLCASCHLSNALPGTGLPGIPALTAAVHGRHQWVLDPATGASLGDSANRDSCYRCHPGSATKCLRGAMGSAVAPDGTRSMQCQSCHGGMAAVGDPARAGWLDQPTCQNCHTGTAVVNAGQIRFLSALDATGARRAAPDATFATESGVPAPGFDLYRFSRGHGGLACEACHGPTHAESPSSHPSDNLQSVRAQGHEGPLSDCRACHGSVPSTVSGGPHGLHPVGSSGWVGSHGDAVESVGAASCRACHGTDYRGTVLSRAEGDRSFSTDFGNHFFWRGFQVGCYACHDGPASENAARNHPAVATGDSVSTLPGKAVAIPLQAQDPDGDPLTLRVVDQPAHGTAGLSGSAATYIPDPGFSGTDSFTFAAWDGRTDSNLGLVSVLVTATAPPPVLPDLAVSCPSLKVKPPKNGNSRASLKPWFLVENHGTAKAPATKLKVLLSADPLADAGDAVLATLQVPALAPGAHKDLKPDLRPAKGVSPAGMFLIAVANPDSAFVEMSRENNTVVVGPME